MKCRDCDLPADLHIGEHGFCCNHYEIRVSNMRRNADKAILENHLWRLPTDDEREKRSMLDAQYARRRVQEPPQELRKAKEALTPASSFASRYRRVFKP